TCLCTCSAVICSFLAGRQRIRLEFAVEIFVFGNKRTTTISALRRCSYFGNWPKYLNMLENREGVPEYIYIDSAIVSWTPRGVRPKCRTGTADNDGRVILFRTACALPPRSRPPSDRHPPSSGQTRAPPRLPSSRARHPPPSAIAARTAPAGRHSSPARRSLP